MTSRAWRIQDGLPDQMVQAIAQTPDHYLWLGTKLGLVRFDGYHFLDYGADVAPVLHDFGVDCILVGRDGSLWLGTQGGGVVHLLPRAARTYGTGAGLENELVRALYQDGAGRIWAGTDHGLYRLDPASGDRFVRVDDPVRIPNLAIHAIAGDGRGGLWAGGSRLLHFRNVDQPGDTAWEEMQLPRQPVSLRIWALAQSSDSDKTLWIGTLGGLFRMPSTGKAVEDRRIPGGTLSLQMDGRQRLWAGTLGDGLYVIDRDGGLTHATAPNELASVAVLSMAEDRGHDLWVGTQSGLTRFSATGMSLKRIPGVIDSEFGSVTMDADRSLWVCSRELIHLRQDRAEKVVLPSLQGIAVRSVMRERSGAFWAGTLGSGAYRIAPGGHVDHYTAAIGTNYIRGFLETPEDGVWIASDGGIANWKNGHVTSFQDAPSSPHAPVIALAAGAPGELWIGTYRGLSLLQHGRFVASPAAVALGSHMVRALLRSGDGALWIGTENGLFRWRDGQLRRLPVDGELGGPAILSILEDGRGRIWLGGPTTVLRVGRAALEALAEGLSANHPFSPEIFAVARETGAELNGGAVSSTLELDGTGGAWFATNEGPLHIQADEAPFDVEPPPIMLGRVAVDGRRVAVDGPVVLQPSSKTLELDATPITLSARPGLQLRRKLIGFDTDWTSIVSLQPATYTNLPPGNYIYRVEANWKGSNAVTALEVPIVQQTHFYWRPLFLVVCLVVLLLIGWLIHLLRVRQVTFRFRLVAEERNRVAREMHDTVVQSCIGVSSLLEAIAIRQAQSPPSVEQQDLLETAREQIASTIVEARDAIWNLRHPHGDGGLSHSLRSMLDRMTAIQNAVVEFECEGEPTALGNEAEHELLMTAREALHNAIVHGAPQHIFLGLRYGTERVTIRIRDDGAGFTPAAARQDEGEHYGLLGMRERMERIGGSCSIESVPGGGATVVLELPLRRRSRSPQETR